MEPRLFDHCVHLNKSESELLAITKLFNGYEKYWKAPTPVDAMTSFFEEHYWHMLHDGNSKRMKWIVFKKLFQLYMKVGPIEDVMETSLLDLFDRLFNMNYEGQRDVDMAISFLFSKLQCVKVAEKEEDGEYRFHILFDEEVKKNRRIIPQ